MVSELMEALDDLFSLNGKEFHLVKEVTEISGITKMNSGWK